MKIISKFKDYYDHVGQMWGVDNNVVYVRDTTYNKLDIGKNSKFLPLNQSTFRFNTKRRYNEFTTISILYGRKLLNLLEYYGGRDFGTYYIGSIDELENFFKENGMDYGFTKKNVIEAFFNRQYKDIYREVDNECSLTEEQLKAPIIVFGDVDYYSRKISLNPQLTKFSVQHYVDAQTMYQEIEMYLASIQHPEVSKGLPGSPTDMIRFEQQGFDKKTSFRNL